MIGPDSWRAWRPRLILVALVVTLLLAPGWMHDDWRMALQTVLAAALVTSAGAAWIATARRRQ